MVKSSTTSKKVESSSNSASSALEQVQSLQQALLSSSDLNPLSDLLSLSKKLAKANTERTPKQSKDAAIALHRAALVLVHSMKALCGEDRIPFDKDIDKDGYILSYGAKASNKQVEIAASGKAREALNKVQDWIRMRWNETLELLCGLLGHEVEGLRFEALQMLVELQTSASSSLTRIVAAVSAAKASARNGLGNKKDNAGGAPESMLSTPALWSASPWRALTLALIAGPPSLNKIENGEAGTRHKVLRVGSGVPEDVRTKFVQSGLEEYDDVRFATLREISHALHKPSPSVAGNTQLRAHTLALLIQLTAIPTTADDLNNFLVEELSIPPLGSAGRKKKSKKASNGTKNLSVVDDGDSDEAPEEEEDDIEGWFSDSDDERNGATAGEQRKAADKKAVGGLGAAARSASSSNKRKRRSLHEALHNLSAQRSAFSSAWTNLLLPRRHTAKSATAAGVPANSLIGGDLSLAATHEVLVRLHAQILPHLTKPTLLHDFLVSCLDSHGATALLALNGIFTLVTKHNLDYPQFYNRLYSMLDASVLHMKYRARFLRLLETFLSSTHLSSTLVASFAKRLSRLSLRAPPAAIASVVPFVYNLLKSHPRCLSMVHKEWDGDRLNTGPAGVSDPFSPDEKDPLKTNALDSSLWELASFGAAAVAKGNSGGPSMGADGGSVVPGEAHYLGSVTSLARILAEPFTRERYSLDDFLDITYATLFETETKKTLKRPAKQGDAPRKKYLPALVYSLPGGFGAGGSTDVTNCNNVDIFPSESGRAREKESLAKAQREEEEEIKRDREEKKRKLGIQGDEEEDEDEDEEEREAREAIEELKREERAKKRKVDQTGTHDVCAILFSFA
ncbi:related to NOC4-nucleolar protein, mediates maturation and nuclear export of 40S ribosomal subunits [Ustilago bromivora]|uniref:Related to NOC4 - nucleolar protein, mediates maturation and nuclear export of 40S ribosomal subunits n=1 Tax=Ustilago bromivora TaxID=307758 RepID=A0A1K0FVN0_9BASI|nr:related to NOC4-nucleolar protein, mediates maturation and nuclear export of 40S ribosomal subunits [Ustilago bromivora]SYW75490.1 related to NOC4 - nucleolar protein, mediates maturation and nuclear export of 40S ribosomal subunits [Ustilago bromivora]